jgi:hypothetical protein
MPKADNMAKILADGKEKLTFVIIYLKTGLITEIIKEFAPIFRECSIKQVHLMADLYKKSRESQKTGCFTANP